MNETVNVSIAGIGFVFDTDACEALKNYLNKIERDYRNDPDGKEILGDIEARIVEIILSEQPVENVVSKPLIDNVIARMGAPEEFGPETDAQSEPEEIFPKRLYRNPEGAKMGGVFSGLATFFNSDPVWFRLGFFLPLILTPISGILRLDEASGFIAILFGIFIFLYLIMWIVVPLARTPRQKLEMRGRKITVSSIEKGIRRDAGHMTSKVARTSSLFYEIMTVIGTIIVVIMKFILLVIGVALGLFALVGFALLVWTLARGGTIFTDLWEYSRWLPVDIGRLQLDGAVLILTAMIPALIFTLLIFGFIFKTRISKTLFSIMGAVWFIGFGYSLIYIPKDVRMLNITYNIEKVLTRMERDGYQVTRDIAGNIILPNDTLVYANENVGLKKFAQRVTKIVDGDVEFSYFSNYRGGEITIVKKVHGSNDDEKASSPETTGKEESKTGGGLAGTEERGAEPLSDED